MTLLLEINYFKDFFEKNMVHAFLELLLNTLPHKLRMLFLIFVCVFIQLIFVCLIFKVFEEF